jgi:hypothetical protein
MAACAGLLLGLQQLPRVQLVAAAVAVVVSGVVAFAATAAVGMTQPCAADACSLDPVPAAVTAAFAVWIAFAAAVAFGFSLGFIARWALVRL